MDNLARQPRGVPTGGQFATSARAESPIVLDDPTPADPSCWESAGFETTWPSMVGDQVRFGTVRTTNGGEISGILTSHGTTYSIDVHTVDGRAISIPSQRVASVRIESPAELHPAQWIVSDDLRIRTSVDETGRETLDVQVRENPPTPERRRWVPAPTPHAMPVPRQFASSPQARSRFTSFALRQMQNSLGDLHAAWRDIERLGDQMFPTLR